MDLFKYSSNHWLFALHMCSHILIFTRNLWKIRRDKKSIRNNLSTFYQNNICFDWISKNIDLCPKHFKHVMKLDIFRWRKKLKNMRLPLTIIWSWYTSLIIIFEFALIYVWKLKNTIILIYLLCTNIFICILTFNLWYLVN